MLLWHRSLRAHSWGLVLHRTTVSAAAARTLSFAAALRAALPSALSLAVASRRFGVHAPRAHNSAPFAMEMLTCTNRVRKSARFGKEWSASGKKNTNNLNVTYDPHSVLPSTG